MIDKAIDYVDALGALTPDLIVSDFQMPTFDAFSQERDDFTVKYQGLGMGMAITKHCLEMDDASIAIDSIKGEGTTVTITF